jgi:hypothetical protein
MYPGAVNVLLVFEIGDVTSRCVPINRNSGYLGMNQLRLNYYTSFHFICIFDYYEI